MKSPFFFTFVTLFESILTLPTLNCITYPSKCAQPLQTYKLKKKVRKSSAKSLDCCFELSEPAHLLSTQFKPALASLNNSSSLTWDPSVYFHRGGGLGDTASTAPGIHTKTAHLIFSECAVQSKNELF